MLQLCGVLICSRRGDDPRGLDIFDSARSCYGAPCEVYVALAACCSAALFCMPEYGRHAAGCNEFFSPVQAAVAECGVFVFRVARWLLSTMLLPRTGTWSLRV